MKRITPCLWFDTQAAEAAKYYCSIFKKSKILSTSYYGEEGKEIHGKPPGSVLTVEFELNGNPFTALNGGPLFKFSEAVSFQVYCETPKELDYYWKKLSKGGNPKFQQCGWLKDKFGVSWQVVPLPMKRWVTSRDKRRTERVMKALFPMKKLDWKTLEKAYQGR